MIVPIPYVHCGFGLLMILVSVPLVLRKIPMNRAYGFRIRKSFVSQNNWYEINAYGGKLMLAFGFFVALFGLIGPLIAPPPASLWTPVFLVVPLLPGIPLIALVSAFARRLPEA